MSPDKEKQKDLMVEYYDLLDQIAFFTPPYDRTKPETKPKDSPKILKLCERIAEIQEEERNMKDAGTWTPSLFSSIGPHVPISWV